MNRGKIKIFFTGIMLSTSFFYALDAEANVFLRDLRMGMTGEDVYTLQTILNSDIFTMVSVSGAGSPENETDFFGEKTRLAVIRFQEKYGSEILIPQGLYKGTGIVGPKTREKLNFLSLTKTVPLLNSTNNTSTTSVVLNKKPILTSFSSAKVKEGDKVTLKGENFSDINTITINSVTSNSFVATSTDTDTIEFIFHTDFSASLANLFSQDGYDSKDVQEVFISAILNEYKKDGKTASGVPGLITVSNESGQSNSLSVFIDLNK